MATKSEPENNLALIEALFNSLPFSYVFWKNTDGIYMGASTKQIDMFDTRGVGFIGKTIFEILEDKKAAQAIEDIDNKVMRDGISVTIEEPVTTQDGEKRMFLSQKQPIRDSENNIIGLIGFSIDISERKKLEDELVASKKVADDANKAKDDFIRNMSHDIRTPLSGIIGMSTILENEVHGALEKEHAHMVSVSGEKLLALLNGVLDIISAGSQKENQVSLSTFSLEEMIHNIADLELPTIKFKNLDLRVNLEKNLPKLIESDQIKIHRILLNILGNSVKFTEKGYIEIGAKLCSDKAGKSIIEFHVEDTGIGIQPDELNKIFKKFFRGTSSSKGVYSGYGVGLHIVKRYIQLLDGKIEVESSPGEKTRFTVHIPVKIIESVAEEPIVAPEKPRPQLPPSLKVLLLEDNAIAMKSAEIMLTELGLTCYSAITGEQGIALFKEHPVDFVLTDIGLPDLSGFDVARRLREIERDNGLKPVPVFGLTAHFSMQIEPGSGIDEIFSKPLRSELIFDIATRYKLASKNKSNRRVGLVNITDFSQFPLVDEDEAIKNLGSREILTELLISFLQDCKTDLDAIEDCWQEKNYAKMQHFAHKMRSGAIYCGAIRMKNVCQLLENQIGDKQPDDVLAKSMQQLRSIVHDTIDIVGELLH